MPEFKRVGMWKCRVLVRACYENKVFLDGTGFDYAANVCELASIRNLLFAPRSNPYVSGDSGADTTEASDTDADPIVIAQIDAATAYLQSKMYGPNEPRRYLKVYRDDPVTRSMRYFWQRGVLYGAASSAKRWGRTLHGWLTGKDAGFTQGANEKCAFYHKERRLSLLT